MQIPKIGLIRFAKSKDVQGRILKATLRYAPSGKYFISITSEQEVTHTQPSLFHVGLDVGLKDFVTTSDGTKIENPKWLRKTEEKLKKAQQCLSRKKIGF